MANKNQFHNANDTDCTLACACEKTADNYIIKIMRAECMISWFGDLLDDALQGV